MKTAVCGFVPKELREDSGVWICTKMIGRLCVCQGMTQSILEVKGLGKEI